MFGSEIAALVQVLLVDVALSGDNAVIIGALAAGLAPELRNKAIYWGMGGAVVLRIILSAFASVVLSIPFVMVIGGLLLAWIAFKLARDLLDDGAANDSVDKQPDTFKAAILAIIGADLSMSVDNVLGVAGAAGSNYLALVVGLMGSVLLMVVAAKVIAGLIERHKWIAWVGFAMIAFVSAKMIWHGIPEVTTFLKAHA